MLIPLGFHLNRNKNMGSIEIIYRAQVESKSCENDVHNCDFLNVIKIFFSVLPVRHAHYG